MDRVHGNNLFEVEVRQLAVADVNYYDTALRNIMLSNDGRLFIIDFGGSYMGIEQPEYETYLQIQSYVNEIHNLFPGHN